MWRGDGWMPRKAIPLRCAPKHPFVPFQVIGSSSSSFFFLLTDMLREINLILNVQSYWTEKSKSQYLLLFKRRKKNLSFFFIFLFIFSTFFFFAKYVALWQIGFVPQFIFVFSAFVWLSSMLFVANRQPPPPKKNKTNCKIP